MYVIGLIIAIAFLMFLTPLIYRKFMNVSIQYKQNKFHGLSKAEIDDLVNTNEKCFLVGSQMSLLHSEPAIIKLLDDRIEISTDSDKEISIKYEDIQKIESVRPAFIAIFDKDFKITSYSNKGRVGIFFGEKNWTMIYGELPFKWQPGSKRVYDTDKVAVAYSLKIQEKIEGYK